MKVLLTGAFGNVGTYCLQELIRQQHQVRCLHRKSKRAEKIAAKFVGCFVSEPVRQNRMKN